eukprot:g71287.t1
MSGAGGQEEEQVGLQGGFDSDTEEAIIPLLMLSAARAPNASAADQAGQGQHGHTPDAPDQHSLHALERPPLLAGSEFALFDEERGMVLGAGQWCRSLLLPSAHWYPTLNRQAPVGWRLTLSRGGGGPVQYGSVCGLETTELCGSADTQDLRHLRAWRNACAHTARLEPEWAACYQWRILAARPPHRPRQPVRFGDRVLFLNVHYQQFLGSDDLDHPSVFLRTFPERGRASAFSLLQHVPLPGRHVAQLEADKRALELAAQDALHVQAALRDAKAQVGASQREAQRLRAEKERLEESKRLADSEVDSLNEQRTCIICFDRQRNVRFDPCGHVCCCNVCAEDLPSCPVDRRAIRLKQPVFVYLYPCLPSCTSGPPRHSLEAACFRLMSAALPVPGTTGAP